MGSITYQLLHECPGFQPGYNQAPSSNTIEQYKTHSIRAAKWIKATFHCNKYQKMKENAVEYLNAYSKWLQETGKSAATIHTYMAAAAYAFDVPMDQISKPIRHCVSITRSRGIKAVDQRKDAQENYSPRLSAFAKCVYGRRRDYLRLRGNNLRLDESGYLCVEICKGKGGKYQLQRILPEDVDFVQSYFSFTTDFVFTKEEMNNKIDLHHIRALGAQKAYAYYLNRINNEPGYREQLTQEIAARWRQYRGKPPKDSNKKHDWDWHDSLVQGYYTLRGQNRDAAIKKNIPLSYNRLAVMAVSVFHLSHWRCNVTVNNYLMAVDNNDEPK